MSTETVNFNGREFSEDAFSQAASFAINSTETKVRTPQEIQNILGVHYQGDRDLYEVLGYPKNPGFDEYKGIYDRGDVGARIIKLPAEDTWKYPPVLSDSDQESDTDSDSESQSAFERDVKSLEQKTHCWQYIKRTDKLAGIGNYALLFIGVKEEGEADLSEELSPGSLNGPDDISYFQPFAQDSVEEWELGKDLDLTPNDEMYNKPVVYKIDFSNREESEQDLHRVHHSRLLHVPAGPRDESELKASPRLEPVLNRLIDLQKVVGASAEMFWSGASRIFQFDIDSEDAMDIPEDQMSQMDEEAQQLVHEMRQHIKTFDTDIEVIDGDDPDPTGVVDSILKFIAGATGIPQRILVGTERGDLASSQDKANWFGQVEMRQNNFVESAILRPFIGMMVDLGVLSDPKEEIYDVEWPNLFELTELEQAEVQKVRSEIWKNLATSGISTLPTEFEQIFENVQDGTLPEFEEVEQRAELPNPESLMEMVQDNGNPPPSDDGIEEQEEQEEVQANRNKWSPFT